MDPWRLWQRPREGASQVGKRDASMAENSKETATKKRGRGPGKVFKPGQSGNPGGRPKLLKELKDKIQLRGDELVEKLFSIAVDPPKVRKTGRKVFIDGPSARERVMAIEKLLAYAYGRPVLAVEVSGPGGGPVQTRDIDKLTSAERAKRLVELMVKAGARVVAEKVDAGDGGGTSGT
jgi:hypothetical protein